MADTAQTGSPSLRHASLVQVLHALALGRSTSVALTRDCLAAIERDRALNAWTWVDAEGALAAAAASDVRRAQGRPLGRLDGVPIAVKDNIDVAGMPTGLGLPAREVAPALRDAAVIDRLRGAGAVLLGKTNLDEAALGTMGRNPHFGDVGNPAHSGRAAGGSSAGSAAAVAAGHAIAALGTDTMGSARIPAAFCGLVGLKPTCGHVPLTGVAPALRRADVVGVIARAVEDASLVLGQLLGLQAHGGGRQTCLPFAAPDWSAGQVRVGVVGDLSALGADATVRAAFAEALARCAPAFGEVQPLALELATLDVAPTRRAALLLMEAEVLAAHADAVVHGSPRLRKMLDYARHKTAVDYARADRLLDQHVARVCGLFERFDVLLLPTVPSVPPALGSEEPAHLADFTALASLAGCPALSLPLREGVGLQLVGAPRSDLRLLELGEVLQALVDCQPE